MGDTTHRDSGATRSTGRPPWLTRAVIGLVAVEGVLLAALGAAGLVTSSRAASAAGSVTAQTPTEVLGLRLNPAHGILLLVTGLLALATLRYPRWRRRFVTTQTLVYMLLYAFGLTFAVNRPTNTMWDLNAADHVLHAVLFLLGLTLTLTLYSASYEPPVMVEEERQQRQRADSDN